MRKTLLTISESYLENDKEPIILDVTGVNIFEDDSDEINVNATNASAEEISFKIASEMISSVKDDLALIIASEPKK